MRQLATHALTFDIGSVRLGDDLPCQVFDRHPPRLGFTGNATVRGQRAENLPRLNLFHRVVDQLAPIAVIGIVTGINGRVKVLGLTRNPTLSRMMPLDGEIAEPLDLAGFGVRFLVAVDLLNRAVFVFDIPLLLCHVIFTDQRPDPTNPPNVEVLPEYLLAISLKS